MPRCVSQSLSESGRKGSSRLCAVERARPQHLAAPGNRFETQLTAGGRARLAPQCNAAGERVSALGSVTPGRVPVLARGVDDAAVGFEKLVGNLEDREHQPALGKQGDVAAARL